MTPYELERKKTDDPDVELIELSGELDLTNADELEQRLDAIARPGARLVVDLNRVSFVDSAALHALFRVARRLGQNGTRFGIVLEPSAVVARTLTIVGLPEVAPVRPSLDELLAELKPL